MMNCADARHIILSADPRALRDRTDPVLRAHLDGCADCARAASHVVADLDRLRAALIARGVRAVPARARRVPQKSFAMTLVPVALAAELAFFALIGTKGTFNPLTDRVVIDDTVTTMLPAAAPAPAARRPDSASILDSLSRRRDSIAAMIRRLAPTATMQYAAFDTADRPVAVVWKTRGDTL